MGKDSKKPKKEKKRKYSSHSSDRSYSVDQNKKAKKNAKAGVNSSQKTDQGKKSPSSSPETNKQSDQDQKNPFKFKQPFPMGMDIFKMVPPTAFPFMPINMPFGFAPPLPPYIPKKPEFVFEPKVRYVIFKYRNAVPDVMDYFNGLVVSIKLSGADLFRKVCQKILMDVELKCKERGLKEIAERINKKFLPMLLEEDPEKRKKKEDFSEGVKNLDYEVQKFLNQFADSDAFQQIFKLEKSTFNFNELISTPAELNDYLESKESEQERCKIFEKGLTIFKENQKKLIKIKNI